MKTFYIFRHARALQLGEAYGDRILTAEILLEAKPPIKRLAQYLKTKPVDACYSSEILRCVQTAQIVGEVLGKEFTPDARLNEFYVEQFPEFYDRVKRFLDEIEKLPAQHIAICTHGAVIGGLKNFLVKGEFEFDDLLDFPTSGVLLTIHNQHVEEKDFNVKGSEI